MKKIILTAMAFVAMMGATAQNTITPIEIPEGFDDMGGVTFIPTYYTYNNVAYCYYYTIYQYDHGERYDSAYVVDKNFQVIKKLGNWFGQEQIRNGAWYGTSISNICPIILGGVAFTQTLFNDDSKFEYVLPVIDDTYIVRLDIYNDEGSVVSSILMDEGYSYDMGCGINMYQLEDKSYLGFRIFPRVREGEIDAEDVKYVLYRIDRQTQSIARVNDVPFNVFPTVADRNSEITVQLEEGTNAREIVVVDAMGREVKSVPVAQGQREVKISTQGLGAGLGFVSDRKNGAVKIIVR